MKLIPHQYQNEALAFLGSTRVGGLFLDPGLGKTSIMLRFINVLNAFCDCKKTLIIAPLRVCYSVWPAESQKWDMLRHLKTSIVHGKNEDDRLEALKVDADIYLINPEGVVWLSEQDLSGFDTLIIDESTKFKSPKMRTKKNGPTRFAALKKMLPQFDRRYILTGTPSPNTLMDLWSQIFILDEGERLGKNITTFRNRWFTKGWHHGIWNPKPKAKEQIEAAISDLVLVMNCRELLDMPELIFNDIMVELPPDVRQAYNKLESDLFFELDSIDETALTSASKYGLCRQVANGGLYVDKDEDGPRQHATAHDSKLDALADLIDELNGSPLMVVYHYKHELERLKERFGSQASISGGTAAQTVLELVDEWNMGLIPILFVQPQSMSHGLNMQQGGRHIAWLGPTDDLEIWLQTIARLWRQGQTGSTIVYTIMAENTVDVAIRNRINEKDETQKSLLKSLQDYEKSK